MAEHYDVYLTQSVPLPVETDYVDDSEALTLTFGAPWKPTRAPGGLDGLAFSDTDRTVFVPIASVALLEIWED